MKKSVSIGLLLIVALVLTSCGGGGGGSASKTINVTMTDFHFNPSTFTIPAGQQITFKGRNNGAVAHDFIIMKYGTSAGDSFDAQDQPNVFWQTEIQPGQSTEQTFTAPTEPGDYEVLCGIPGHLQAGMTAKLTVTP